jgi:ribosomal protein S20
MFTRLRGLFLAEKPKGISRPATAEVGDTGMGYAVGSGTTKGAVSKRLRTLEQNWELYERNGYVLYDRMRFSDPKVAGLLRAMRLPILGAQVSIEPSDPEDERAKEIAEFVSDNLLHSLADSWRATLYQFLLYLCHGFAPFEMVWKIEDGKALIDRFAYRPPATIATRDIFVANGRIEHVHQSTDTGFQADIPGEKLLWFVNDREGDDFCGRALLRPMFKPWFGKEKLEILLLIAADRGNGTPVVIAPEGGWGTDTSGNALGPQVDDALAAFSTSERGFFHFPFGTTFTLETSNASIAELTALKANFEMDMSNVAIAQILDLGKTETGSRALGRTMSDMFLDSLTAIAVDVEDTVNAKGGPIHQLVDYNFAGADDLMPSLRFGSLSKIDLKTLALAFFQLKQMGMPFGEETWEWIRSELDLPPLKAEEATGTPQEPLLPDARLPAPEVPPEPPPTPTPPGQSPPGQTPPQPVPPAQASEIVLAEKHYWREPRGPELYADLADIGARLDAAPAALRTATQTAREGMVAELVRRAQAAIASGDVAKVAALAQAKPPMVDKLTAAVRGVLHEAAAAGAAQVRDELARQKAGTPVVEQAIAERQGTSVQAAQRKPPKKTAPPTWAEDLNAYIDAQADVTARQIASVTQAALAAEAMRGLATKVSADALTAMVTRASDEAALRAGLTVTHIMATGRADEALANREKIELAFYSAILDNNTCTTCEEADGQETTDLDEAAGWTPNPDCDGGANCRCETFFELKEGA